MANFLHHGIDEDLLSHEQVQLVQGISAGITALENVPAGTAPAEWEQVRQEADRKLSAFLHAAGVDMDRPATPVTDRLVAIEQQARFFFNLHVRRLQPGPDDDIEMFPEPIDAGDQLLAAAELPEELWQLVQDMQAASYPETSWEECMELERRHHAAVEECDDEHVAVVNQAAAHVSEVIIRWELEQEGRP